MAEQKIIKGWLTRTKTIGDGGTLYNIYHNLLEMPCSCGGLWPDADIWFGDERFEKVFSPDLHLSPGECIPIEIVHPDEGGTLIRRAEK